MAGTPSCNAGSLRSPDVRKLGQKIDKKGQAEHVLVVDRVTPDVNNKFGCKDTSISTVQFG